MKKLCILLMTVCTLAFCILALSSCGVTLEAPHGFDFNEETQTLSWEKIEGAIGYSVLVGDKEKTTKSNSFIVEITERGEYQIKVKALGDGRSVKDSVYAVYTYEKEESESGLRYELYNNNTEYRLVSLGSASGDVVMEETFRGKDVTAIAEGALSNNGKLTSFTFNSKITEIPKKAFYNCNALISVTIPKNIVKIGPNAFQSCRSLKSVVIPDEVTVIEEYAFSYCRELVSVTFSPDTTKIGNYAFSDCTALEAIHVPDKVTHIGEYAFSGCKGATELTLGAAIESIGNYAFYYCQGISKVVIPDKVTEIGESAFESCVLIPSINLPESVTSLGDRVFAFCEALAEIEVGTSLEYVGQNVLLDTAYYNDYAEDVVYLGNWIIACKNPEIQKGKDLDPVIKAGTVGIADRAFRGCSGFTGVSLHDIKYIGDFAFYDCEKLVQVYLGKDAQYIGDYAFTLCEKLRTVLISDTKIEYIGDFAFNGCKNLSNVVLPKTVKSIGTQVFDNTAIKPAVDGVLYVGNWVVGNAGAWGNVTLKDGVVGIADYSFYNCMFIQEFKMPSTVETIGRGAFLLCMQIRIEEFSENLKKIDDYAFYGCSAALFGPADGTDEDYHLTLPDGLEYIGRSAFYQSSVFGLTIPGSCKYIGDYAFFGASLLGAEVEFENNTEGEDTEDKEDAEDTEDLGSNTTKVRYYLILEEGIEHIGSRAFFGCSGLIDVAIPDSVTSLGIRSFFGCTSLKTAVIGSGLDTVPAYTFYGCKQLAEVTFSHGVKTIDKYAFRGCESLSNLDLPEGLKTIGAYAFHGCNAIKRVHIPKSVTTIDNFAFRKDLANTSITLHSGISDLGQHVFYMNNAATIYTENESKPESWNERWNSSYRPVVWGCTLSNDKSYVVSFVMGEDTIENESAINGILAPARDGYTFDGWALSEDGEVAYSAAEIVDAKAGEVLYAIWTPVAAD